MANVGIAVAAIAAIIVSGGQTVAEVLDPGKAEYHSSCAPCHGNDGKGTGPVSAGLKVPPPDLTVLAKKNNRVFPFNSVYEIIDGRKTVGCSRHARYADLGRPVCARAHQGTNSEAVRERSQLIL